jgi:DNA-binding response OmpR family regulator
MSLRALVVEDEPDLALAVRLHLEAEGFEVDEAGDGDAAVLAAREGRFDVILLDLRLPKRDGIDVLRAIRDAGDRTPVVCVTARAEERDRVLGLDLGADDYVTKPFSAAELMARVRAVLRRSRGGREGEIDLGDVRILLDERAAVVRGERVDLTATEAQILRYLADRDGAVVERARMLRDLWGVDETVSTRTLDNHVARIRKKIERDAAAPQLLVTVHGAGYRLAVAR